MVSILAAQTAPWARSRRRPDPLPVLPPPQTSKTIGALSPSDHRTGLLPQQPGQDGLRSLPRFGIDHLQWPGGGRRQDHRRSPAQTQRHALDACGRAADPQPTSPGAIETMGCFLELVPRADHADNNPENGSVKPRLHPIDIATIMFLDDQPFERDEVQSVHGDVACLDAIEYRSLLRDKRLMPRFITEDASQRRHIYMDNIRREQEESAFSG